MQNLANPNLRDFWDTPSRYKVLYGGRSSSKSWDAAIVALVIAQQIKVKILCTRKFQNRIEESVYSLLKEQITRLGYTNEFTILNNKITHNVTGSEFLFYGLARNIQEIKSLEGVDICWNEESQYLTKDDLDLIIPTIRKDHSEIWFIFNPYLETDYVYENFVLNPPKNAIVRHINYDENPWLPNVIKDEIEEKKRKSYDDYLHIYKGHPKKDDDDVFIRRTWIEASVDAHIKLDIQILGKSVVGYDVADAGDDKNALCHTVGVVTSDIEQWSSKKDEMIKNINRSYSYTLEKNATLVYDPIGVGVSVGSKVNEINETKEKQIEHIPFNASGAIVNKEQIYQDGIKNKDYFHNLKAQAWGRIADRFQKTYNAVINKESINDDEIISISSNCKELKNLMIELSTPKKELSMSGRVKVESKEHMKKRGINSPNLADAFVMANCLSLLPRKQTMQIL